MRKNRLVKMTVAIVALAALVTGGYLYKDAIQSRIARTVAVVSGQEIKPLLDSESRYIRQIVAKDNSTSRTHLSRFSIWRLFWVGASCEEFC